MDFESMKKPEAGFFFDPATGRVYYDDNPDDTMGPILQPYTFEDATWTGPFMNMLLIVIPGFRLNPLGFATKDTAVEILRLCSEQLKGTGYTAILDERQRVVGPYTRTIERLISVSKGAAHIEDFAAGRIAVSVIRQGTKKALSNWLYEVRHAELASQ